MKEAYSTSLMKITNKEDIADAGKLVYFVLSGTPVKKL